MLFVLMLSTFVPLPEELATQVVRVTVPFPPVQFVSVSDDDSAFATVTVMVPESSVPLIVMTVVPPETIDVGEAKTLAIEASALGDEVAARISATAAKRATGASFKNSAGNFMVVCTSTGIPLNQFLG